MRNASRGVRFFPRSSGTSSKGRKKVCRHRMLSVPGVVSAGELMKLRRGLACKRWRCCVISYTRILLVSPNMLAVTCTSSARPATTSSRKPNVFPVFGEDGPRRVPGYLQIPWITRKHGVELESFTKIPMPPTACASKRSRTSSSNWVELGGLGSVLQNFWYTVP